MTGNINRKCFNSFLRRGLLLALVFMSGRLALAQTAVGTAFTYQGILAQSGSPVDGAYQMKFNLYGVASGGSALAPEVALTAVTVSKGRFAVDLDFGAAAFTTDARWLDIAVRPGASGSYTVLGRQRLRPVPFAIQAQSAQTAKSVPWSALTGVPAGLADGDDNTLYSAGAGLQLLGTQFNVVFAGSGAAGTSARSDHDHNGTYLTPNGPELISSSSTLPTLDVVQKGTPLRPTGLRGQARANQVNAAGVYGIAISTSTMANVSYFPPTGVRGESSGGWGVMGVSDSGFGVFAYCRDNFGMWGQTNSTNPNYYGGYFVGPSGVCGFSNSSLGYAGYFKSYNNSRALYAAGSSTITQNLNIGGTLDVANKTGLPRPFSVQTTSTASNAAAIYAFAGAKSTDATGFYQAGIRGESKDGYGILGLSDSMVGVVGDSTNNYGVWAQSTYGTGLYGVSANSWAGYFVGGNGKALFANGSVTVTQTMSVGKVAYNTPRQHYFSLPGCAFQPFYGDTTVANVAGGGGIYVTGGSVGYITAPVSLPDGATVKSLTGYFYNNGVSSTMNLQLYRVNMAAGANAVLVNISSAINTGLFSASANTETVIDNSVYSYYLGVSASAWTPAQNVRFVGARITYTVGEAE